MSKTYGGKTLDELQRLHDKANPNPGWHFYKDEYGSHGYVDGSELNTVLWGDKHEGAVDEDDLQGRLAADAVNALPYLVADCRMLERIRQDLPRRAGSTTMSEVSAGALQQFAVAMLTIFEGYAELAAMQAENSERARKGEAQAFPESAFWQCQQSTIERTRNAMEWIR